MSTERFFILARHETENWNRDALAAAGIREAFGLYLIRGGEATYCASLSPESWAECLGNAFIWTDDEARENYGGDLDHEGADSMYLAFFDPAKVDSRFWSSFTVFEDGRKLGGLHSESYRAAIWEAAREEAAANGGSLEPGILWGAAFDQWQDECTAKARATNDPPLNPWGDCLPLFTHAANQIAATWPELDQMSPTAWRREFSPLGWMR